ncbi:MULTISPECIES: M20 family metallopeptidase [Desulfococcus]|uniref:Peptidase M20 n=1 Tax=Desulfococcus multivorans DSM 2059 TaxID=1121405 RepID=S7TTM1_DESML|nr:M20/M25/M40 family metallo-hydrolase [Desulfococcus multivorans]AOY57621.1 peptidase, M20 family [Desulfococcus multivorans]AQV00028.1 peptidase M20 [Desulfococcus multivorans]EPR40386.1 peptidase M20 [Desulfococcus multivorans DSM 2059]SJZ77251.1 acetylornithine deacetylase [Desulfococcus multivorans DSM 2059]
MTIQRQRLKRLLKQMIDIYSPSGKEEEIIDFLKTYLARRGLPVKMQTVDENRANLIVGNLDDAPRLALIGHLDTVSAFDLDRYAYEEAGDWIRGLGAADMKGGCAAMIEAFTAWCDTGDLPPGAILCLVVGEEETGDGAWQLMKEHYFPWAVIGEPTGLVPCLRCFGYVEIEVATLGRRIHASVANPRHSPVTVLLRKMLRLIRYFETNRQELVFNIRDLFSNPAGFAVSERCEAWLDVHVPPHLAMGTILSEIEETLQRDGDSPMDVRTEFKCRTIDAGYEIPEKGAVVDALRSIYQARKLAWTPDAFRSHSDANHLWASGVKSIVLGPGDLSQAHTEDESVSFAEVCRAAEIYLDLLRHVMKRRGA